MQPPKPTLPAETIALITQLEKDLEAAQAKVNELQLATDVLTKEVNTISQESEAKINALVQENASLAIALASHATPEPTPAPASEHTPTPTEVDLETEIENDGIVPAVGV